MSQAQLPVEILEVGADLLPSYAQIPIALEVNTIFQVDPINNGLGGIGLREERIEHPYTKDYDALEGEGSVRPDQWPDSFDVRDWGFFLAYDGNRCVGGAAVAFNSPEWERRGDVSVLSDIRVHPEFRQYGIGTKLFLHAANWSSARRCRQMKIETQNVNVPACRFYAKMGCQLSAIDRYAYVGNPEVEHEIMIVWHFDL